MRRGESGALQVKAKKEGDQRGRKNRDQFHQSNIKDRNYDILGSHVALCYERKAKVQAERADRLAEEMLTFEILMKRHR